MLCGIAAEVSNRLIKMNLYVTRENKKELFRLAEHVMPLLVFCVVCFDVPEQRAI
jgi:hypothetical protein